MASKGSESDRDRARVSAVRRICLRVRPRIIESGFVEFLMERLASSLFLMRATNCKDDIQSSSFRLPARPLDLHVRRFRFFEIGNRRPGRVRYGTLSARGGRMVGPEDARGSWSGPGAGFRSHTLPRVFRDRRGLLASGARADDGTIPAGLGLITEGSRGWLKGDSAVWVCRLYIVNGQHGWYQISIRGPVSVS